MGAIGPFDDCPLSAGYSWKDEVGCKDTDGDGYSDLFDSHKNDWTQSSDPDRDGFGDNSSGNLPDGCPLTWGNSTKDIYGCPDVDGDGWSYLSDYNDGCLGLVIQTQDGLQTNWDIQKRMIVRA